MMPEETIKRVRALQAELNRILEQETKKSRPPAPPTEFNRFTISVEFTSTGMRYEYLVLRVGSRYYTTGTGDDGMFRTWGSFLDWLDGMYWHSAMVALEGRVAGAVVITQKVTK